MGWLATLASFRGAPADALVRVGAESAVVARVGAARDGRAVAHRGIDRAPRGRDPGAGQPSASAADRATCSGSFRVTVFSPDDLVLVKGGPAERRRYLDDLLVSCHPRWDAVRGDLDRVLRQRATPAQAGGRAADAGGVPHARRVGRPAGHAGHRAGLRSGLARRASRAGGGQGLRAAGRAAGGGRVVVLALRGAGWGLDCGTGGGAGATTSAGVSPRSVPTATTWSSASTVFRRARTPRRASSAPWRWRCGWAGTPWSPGTWGSRPCCCSTTCSASSTRPAPPPCRPPAGRTGAAHHRRPRARRGGARRPPDRPRRDRQLRRRPPPAVPPWWPARPDAPRPPTGWREFRAIRHVRCKTRPVLATEMSCGAKFAPCGVWSEGRARPRRIGGCRGRRYPTPTGGRRDGWVRISTPWCAGPAAARAWPPPPCSRGGRRRSGRPSPSTPARCAWTAPTLVIGVDAPGYATQLRLLSGQLLARLRDLVGPGAVDSVDVRVRP